MKKYGEENFDIEVLEEFEFTRESEIKKKEQKWMDLYPCVNEVRAYGLFWNHKSGDFLDY
jgi:hypothetical protein